MQRLKRLTMLIKPFDTAYRHAVVLRLEQDGRRICVSIKADFLKGKNLSLYLYTEKSGIEPVGSLDGGCLFTTLDDTSIEEIKAGALFDGEVLKFKSDGIERFSALEQLKKQIDKQNKDKVSVEIPPEVQNPEPETTHIEKSSEEAYIDYIPYIPEAHPEADDAERSWGDYEEVTDSVQEALPYAAEMMMPPAVYPTMEKDGCPKPDKTSSIDPFPGVFEQDSWQKLSFSGPGGEWHYIVGEVITDGETLKAIGVPGRFSESAPPWLNGFTTHQSSPGNEGYWLKFIGLQPEERRSPRLSQHDE